MWILNHHLKDMIVLSRSWGGGLKYSKSFSYNRVRNIGAYDYFNRACGMSWGRLTYFGR